MGDKMKRKRYSNDFKLQVVEEYESGEPSLSAISKKHGIHPNLVLNWRKKAMSGSLTESSAELKAKDKEIRRLHELLGKQAMELEFLKNAAAFARRKRNGSSSVISGPRGARSNGGAK